ncbi:hypothetical protein T09_6087, partial [Trichinella sp. T9]
MQLVKNATICKGKYHTGVPPDLFTSGKEYFFLMRSSSSDEVFLPDEVTSYSTGYSSCPESRNCITEKRENVLFTPYE